MDLGETGLKLWIDLSHDQTLVLVVLNFQFMWLESLQVRLLVLFCHSVKIYKNYQLLEKQISKLRETE